MKNKAYYVSQGCLYAFGKTIEVDAVKLVDINNQSWQARAFKEGISWHLPRETSAIVSHLQCLAEEWKREEMAHCFGKFVSPRANRIYSKVKALSKKHGLDHVEIFNRIDWPVAV